MSFATILLMLLTVPAGLPAIAPGLAAGVQAPTPTPMPQQQFPPGEVVENVVSLSDPSQSYAVYLPSAYGPHREWPVLFAMDPRGRARIPLDLFQEAAERHGYIIVSSYNTASDTDGDPNTPAMRAMLADTPQLFFADGERIYLTGFSGTARVGWYFATQLGNRSAGLIGFGGGLPTRFDVPEPLTFAFLGSAGTTDFNYEEMLALEADAAQRLLEKVFVSAAFYGPRDFLRRGEPHRALLLLEVADAIKEENFNVLVSFARAYALAGDEKKAIEALQRADKIVTLQALWLEDDPYLQVLADEPEFQALLRRR